MQKLLLTFANNRTAPLPTLTEEYLQLNRVLVPRAFRQHFLFHAVSHATLSEVAYYLTLFRIRREFMENDEVKNACFFMETLRRQLEQAAIGDMTELCARAETSLAIIFSKLDFLGNYLLATVRNIDVMKYRHTETAIFNKI